MCGPLGIFNSYVSLIQIKIFFGTIRRISSLTNLAVTSWAFSCFLSPGLYGRSKDRFSERSWKRFFTPARWGDVGDSVKGGGSSVNATALLLTSDDGAFGERGEG